MFLNDSVGSFEWAAAMVIEDDQEDDGERRFMAYGSMGNRLHCLVFRVVVKYPGWSTTKKASPSPK